VIAFDIEAILWVVSFCIGALASMSRLPRIEDSPTDSVEALGSPWDAVGAANATRISQRSKARIDSTSTVPRVSLTRQHAVETVTDRRSVRL